MMNGIGIIFAINNTCYGLKYIYLSFKLQLFRDRITVFSATFNNISVISWRSVLLVEETGVPRENH